MVRISRSESGKVTLELTLEELSGVENDLDRYLNLTEPGFEDAEDATRELHHAIESFWIGLPLPVQPTDQQG